MSHDTESDATLIPSSQQGGTKDSALRVEGLERYRDREQLGAGGMGEVRLMHDARLGRDIALKRMHAALTDDSLVRRFLREVRVQGQLQHPAVVPVYDLGLTPEGTPYFTMKRVLGRTLADVLVSLKKGDADTVARFSRWRLLSAFNTVCLAIDSAHSRGVLHRDLKPSNIMLGDFGEVHVLDWGLAKVRDDVGQAADDSTPVPLEMGPAQDHTQLGTAMGTPGYMSPEQAEGRVDLLDARTDVYALGVILHEVLFLEPVHNQTTPVERLISTKRRQLPNLRRADVPPELDAIWRRACAADRDDRFPSARALADAVEQFLDGARDEERRKVLAAQQLELAALSATETDEGRQHALQALGRALALDPTNAKALAQLAKLLAQPPVETPPEAQRQLEVLAEKRTRSTILGTTARLATWTVGMAIAMAVVGVKSELLRGLLLGVLGLSTLTTWLIARSARVQQLQMVAAGLGILSIGTMSVLANPLLVVPSLAATQAMLFAGNAAFRTRTALMLASLASVVLPVVLTPLGPYVTMVGDTMVFTSPLLEFHSPSTPLLLLLMSLVPVVTPTAFVGRLRDAFVAAERAVVIQAAALRHLIPQTERVQESARDNGQA